MQVPLGAMQSGRGRGTRNNSFNATIAQLLIALSAEQKCQICLNLQVSPCVAYLMVFCKATVDV